MIRGLSFEGKATTLKSGDQISFNFNRKTMLISRREKLDHSIVSLRWHGDDKKLVEFIKNEADFENFCDLLAETHGFRISRLEEGMGESLTCHVE